MIKNKQSYVTPSAKSALVLLEGCFLIVSDTQIDGLRDSYGFSDLDDDEDF